MSAEGVGSTREEAERLVAAGLGAVSTALQGMEAKRQLRTLAEQVLDPDRLQDLAAGLNGFVSGVSATGGAANGSGEHHGAAFSTGSADCCVCPVCRVIAALRDPSPEFAEQMATAVGDLAVGLTGLLRAFSNAMATPKEPNEPGESATPGPVPTPRAKPASDPGDAGILDESESNTMSDSPSSGEPGARKPMAKKAVKKAVRRDTGK